MTGQDMIFPDDKVIVLGTKLFNLIMDYTLLRKFTKYRIFTTDKFTCTRTTNYGLENDEG